MCDNLSWSFLMADKDRINILGMGTFICNAILIYQTTAVDNLPTCLLQILNYALFFLPYLIFCHNCNILHELIRSVQFTGARYNRLVEPSRQATFEYGFTPSDTFSSRPFGLTINVNYKDTVSTSFLFSMHSVVTWAVCTSFLWVMLTHKQSGNNL